MKGIGHKNKREVYNIVKDWLEEEGLAVEYLDNEDTDVNCAVIKDNIIQNIAFLKPPKDSLIVSGKVGIQPPIGKTCRTQNWKEVCYITWKSFFCK